MQGRSSPRRGRSSASARPSTTCCSASARRCSAIRRRSARGRRTSRSSRTTAAWSVPRSGRHRTTSCCRRPMTSAAIGPLVLDAHDAIEEPAGRHRTERRGVGVRARLVRAGGRRGDAQDGEPDLPRVDRHAAERGSGCDARLSGRRPRPHDPLARRVRPGGAAGRGDGRILRRHAAAAAWRTRTATSRFWDDRWTRPSRWRASASGRRTASASDRCTRRPGCAATDTRARWWAG